MNCVTRLLLIFGLLSIYLKNCEGKDCAWSGCEGLTISGQLICNHYGLGKYTGMVNGGECSWDTTKVECCKPTAGGECKFTKTCFGTAYGGNYACSHELGQNWVPHLSGETSTEGCGWSLKKHKCCN